MVGTEGGHFETTFNLVSLKFLFLSTWQWFQVTAIADSMNLSNWEGAMASKLGDDASVDRLQML